MAELKLFTSNLPHLIVSRQIFKTVGGSNPHPTSECFSQLLSYKFRIVIEHFNL